MQSQAPQTEIPDALKSICLWYSSPITDSAVNPDLVPETCCGELLLESLQVPVSSCYKKHKRQWHQESASPTQQCGWKGSSLSVVSSKIRHLCVCLITGGNCCPSAIDLALCLSLFPFPTAPEAPHLVMPTQKVIYNVFALHWFSSASTQITAALIEEEAALGAE